MEDNANMFELLLEKAADYSKTSYELVKLKTLGKTSDLVSSFMPLAVILILIASLLLFLNVGIAFWLGKILGKIYYGFFAIAGFYGVIAIVLRFLLYNWLKSIIGNYIIKKAYK